MLLILLLLYIYIYISSFILYLVNIMNKGSFLEKVGKCAKMFITYEFKHMEEESKDCFSVI